MPRFIIKDQEGSSEPMEVALAQKGQYVYICLDGIKVAWLDERDGRLWHMSLGPSDAARLRSRGVKIVRDKIGGNSHWDDRMGSGF